MEYNHPWNHHVFDNFLSEDQVLNLRSCLAKTSQAFHQDEDDEMKINYQFLPDLNLAKYFLSSQFKAFLEKTTGHSLKINPRSVVQLRKMTAESPPMPAHVDNQDEPSVVAILYVSPGWQNSFGGKLHLLKEKSTLVGSAVSKEINPEFNRLVVFESKDHHWHCVDAVQNWERQSILMEWIVINKQELS